MKQLVINSTSEHVTEVSPKHPHASIVELHVWWILPCKTLPPHHDGAPFTPNAGPHHLQSHLHHLQIHHKRQPCVSGGQAHHFCWHLAHLPPGCCKIEGEDVQERIKQKATGCLHLCTQDLE